MVPAGDGGGLLLGLDAVDWLPAALGLLLAVSDVDAVHALTVSAATASTTLHDRAGIAAQCKSVIAAWLKFEAVPPEFAAS